MHEKFYENPAFYVCGFNCEFRFAVCGLKKDKCYSVRVSLSNFLKSFPKCTANAWRPSQTLSQNETSHFQGKMLTKRKNEKTFFWVADWWLELEKLREECKTLRSFRTLKLFSRTFVISCKKQIFDQNFQLFGWIWVLFFSCHQISVVESKLLKVKIHFELESTKTFSFSL